MKFTSLTKNMSCFLIFMITLNYVDEIVNNKHIQDKIFAVIHNKNIKSFELSHHWNAHYCAEGAKR